MIADFCNDYWPALLAVASVLAAIVYNGRYERREGYLRGRADTLREVYGPRKGGPRL